MFKGVFLNTHTGSDEEKDDERLGKTIKDAGKNDKCDVIGVKDWKFKEALDKSDD